MHTDCTGFDMAQWAPRLCDPSIETFHHFLSPQKIKVSAEFPYFSLDLRAVAMTAELFALVAPFWLVIWVPRLVQ